ncbi:hypothetical protein QBC38DRAFT_455315 [Podospora fimiseda]|uniref:Uncharacterized protein n=1 Tax=Podospora fimiseda TaxID=252190 RepID=A0AAN7BPY7_9PEZI|nr:hypothetical protein QBC38DRAFT_455315 [Podospora fimiseda]
MDQRRYRFIIPILILILICVLFSLLIWSLTTSKRETVIYEPYPEGFNPTDQDLYSPSNNQDVSGMPVLASDFDEFRGEGRDGLRERRWGGENIGIKL